MPGWRRALSGVLLLVSVVGRLLGSVETAGCEEQQLEGGRCPAETVLPAGLFWTAGDSAAPYPACCRQRTRGCWRSDLRRWAAPGQQWTIPGCVRVTCDSGALVTHSCGQISLPPGQHCRLQEGDRSAAYPDCCPSVNCTSCWAAELGKSVAVGESWTLQGCSGWATCDGLERVSAVGCALEAVIPGTPCALDNGDPESDDYPKCCPKITCPDCYSKQLQQFFGPGDVWTEPNCVKKQCEQFSNNSVAVVEVQYCSSIIPLPEWNCTRVDEGEASGEYPDCCPQYQCPRHCLVYSDSIWKYVSLGSQWTDNYSCTLLRCGFGGRILKLPCEPLGPAPGIDCFIVSGEGDQFPRCCPFYKCRPTCYSAAHNQQFKIGEKWVVGNGCAKMTCVGDKFGNSWIEPTGPPCELPELLPGCFLQEGYANASYPHCCPQLNCSGCWVSSLGRAVSVGESWTMGTCGFAKCHKGGYGGKGCGLMGVSAESSCMLGSSQPGIKYPYCCPRMTCPDCFSEHLNRHFGPGDIWTDKGCVRKHCTYKNHLIKIVEENCSSRPEAPDEDCIRFEGSQHGDFPSCCPYYQCPRHCFSEVDGRFYAVGEQWTEPGTCVLTRCVAGRFGGVGLVRVQCRAPDAPLDLGSDCRINSDPTADYPFCCPHYVCNAHSSLEYSN